MVFKKVGRPFLNKNKMIELKVRGVIQHSFSRDYGVAVGAVLVAIVLLSVSVRPAVEKIRKLREEQASAQETLTVLTAKVQQLESFAAETEVVDREFEHFNRAIPSKSDVPSILTQIQKIAAASGVNVTAMQFGGGGTPTEGAAGGQGWSGVRVKLVVEGSFDNVVRLLQTLESASRLIDVETVRYNAQTSAEGGSTLSVELTLRAYYTAKPVLLPQAPITFSFTDPSFERNSQVLQRLTPYETEIP